MKASTSSLRFSRRAWNLPGLSITAALTLVLADTASAAVVVSDWASPSSGAWNVDANWINTPATGGFPNNGNGGVPTYDALIDVPGAAYTVTLNTNITVEDLTLNSVNATVDHTSGTFTATGAITLSAGTYQLNGGTISDTDINFAGGNFIFTGNGGILSNGTVFNGNLNLSANSANVRLQSGASFTGVANVSGSGALLAIEDTRTLTGKTINLDGVGVRLNIEGTTTLTLGTGTLLRGQGATGGQVFIGGANALINQAGTIRADLAGSTLTIGGSSFSNQAAGVTEAINGGTLTIAATNWSNTGQINATGGSTLNFNGTWSNAGGTATVDATSTLNLNGASTINSLGTINNSAGGTVNIGGTIDNTGTNLAFNATTGSWRLFGGTISGGQITPGAGGQTLIFTGNGGILSNGALFNGDLNLSANSANVRLQSGASFTGVANVSGSGALLAIEDTRTLTGKTINLDGVGVRLNIEGTTTLTLGTGTLLRGQGATGGQVFIGGANALINQAGTIRADLAGSTLTIGGNSFSNQAAGVTEAINGGTLTIAATNWSNTGQINATGGSTLNFNGTWSNAGGTATVDATSTLNLNGASTINSLGTINNSAGGTVNIGGTIDNTGTNLAFNATTGSWRLFGGTISGGQITPGAGGQTLIFTGNGGILSNGALFNGDLNLSANSANVRLQSGASFTGVANVSGSGALLAIEDTRTLTGKTINLDGVGVRLNIEGTTTLTLGTGTLLRGQGATGGQVFIGGANALINQAGTIRADLAGSTLSIGGNSFSNQAAGVAEAINGSTLTIAATNWSNAGQINATGGSTVNFNGTWSNAGGTATVDATSTLNLNGASTINSLGTINNSAGGTVNIGGTIDNTGTNLTFNATTGSWRLFGGTISGGQITPGAGGQTLIFTGNGGILSNGALFNGDLNLSANSANVRLQSGASFTGVANVSGSSALLAIEDTRTLTGKTINLDGAGARLNIEGTTTLTLGTGTLLRGQGATGGQVFIGGTNALINQTGTIRADLAGSTLTIGGNSFSNQAAGVAEAINGSTLTIAATNWSNAGQINATGGSTVNFNGTWSNAGGTATVDATSTLNLNGASTINSLGTINNSAGGTVNIGGTIDNTGTNLTFNATTGSWRLFGGTISGGQITPGAGGQTLIFTGNGGILSNGALFNGDLNLSANSANVRLQSGASFTGVANVSGSSALLAIEDTRTLTGKTINLDGAGARLNIEGATTLTLGTGTLLRGQGATGGQVFIGGTNALINQAGTIRADLAGSTLTIGGSSFSNQAAGVAEAINGGTLSITSATVTEYTGTALTGGIWRVFANSVLNLPSTGTGVVTNQADITLSGAGSVFRTGAASATLDSQLTTNSGALRILAGRDYITLSAFTNSGVLQLGGGVFTAPGLANTATGEVFGFGTVSVRPTNSGRVRAAGGTLTLSDGVQDGTGTVQIDAGAVLDVSGGASGSGADLLIHNGTAAGSLNLGANNFTVDVDYTNAGFGVGNSFNPRANVSGVGLIMASGGIAQQLTGNVTGGTGATPTLAFGNVHVGDAPTRVYLINTVGGSGPSLRGAIQTSVNGGNITDARLSGTGVSAANFGPIAPGANSGDRAVTFTATSAGALTGQAVGLLNNFDNVGEQTLSITGAAFRFANPTAHTPEPVNFGNRHVGDPAPSQALSITNNIPNDGFSEALDASIGSPIGGVTASGSFSLLAPGATNSASLLVGMNTTTAGSKNGGATISFTSNGTGSSELGLTQLAAQTVNVTGAVYRFANPTAHTPEPVNLGNRHVGDAAPSQALSITNNVPNDGFSEALTASLGGATGGVSASGSFTLLAPGATNNSSLLLSINTATVGNKNGTAVITLVSDGAGSSGLGQTALASQTVNVISSVFRLASASAHTPEPVVFTNRHVGDVAQQAIAITNTAANDGFSEELDAEFGAPTGNATASGSFGQLAPQATNNTSLIVGINTATAGAKSGSVPLNLSSNGSGTSDLSPTALPSQTVNVSGNVYRLASASAHTPEPVALGNRHVGDVAQQALTITNMAANDNFSERLDAAFGVPVGNATASGSVSQLAPQATNNTSLVVGFDTSSAGAKSGSVPLNLTSNGTGTSGLAPSALPAQTVNVSGGVFRFAQATVVTSSPINYGIVHVGDVVGSNLTVRNDAAADGFSEGLRGSISGVSGDANGSGVTGLVTAGSANSTLSVGINTSSAGSKSGIATVAFTSDGAGTSDLGNTALAPQQVSVVAQVNNFAAPVFLFESGGATLTGSGTAFTLDFGTQQLGAAMPQAQLSLRNAASAPADSLAGSFVSNAPDFTLSGFNSFSGIGSGQNLSSLIVGFQTDQVGSFNEPITLNPRSQNPGGFDGSLSAVTLTLRGEVVPEPSALALLALGVPVLGLRRRRH